MCSRSWNTKRSGAGAGRGAGSPRPKSARWVDTRALAGPGVDDLPAGASPTQVAAWTTVARVLLNLDEAITKE